MKSVGMVLQAEVSRVRPFAAQPRTEYDPTEDQDLDGSMAEMGQLEPLLVRRVNDDPDVDFEIISGERRWRSCKRRGARYVEVFAIRVSDADEQFIKSISANAVRARLSHRDTARAVARVWGMERFAKLNDFERQKAVGKMFGHSHTWVEQYVRMGELAPEVQELVDTESRNNLPLAAAANLHKLPRDKQVAIGKAIAESGLRAHDKRTNSADRARREGGMEDIQPGKQAFNRAVDFCRDVARVCESAEALVKANPRLIVNAMLAEPRTKLGVISRLDKAIALLAELRATLSKVGS